MKRPRGEARYRELAELRAELPFVRHAWELGRMRRRTEADLRTILAGTVHTRVVPLRAGDPRAARAQLDRQLQTKLRAIGSFDQKGVIYGGTVEAAHRPFVTETINALRDAIRTVDLAFAQARFSSPLEHIAFTHSPKHTHEDLGATTEQQWHDAWLQITFGRHTKAIACEAIGISEHAYDERRRRPRRRAGGLSINDSELLEQLRELIADETRKLEDQQLHRQWAIAWASERGLRLPKGLRMPTFSKVTRRQLHSDCRFLDDDRVRWKARLARQPRTSHALWQKLIRLREQWLAGTVASFAIFEWIEVRKRAPSVDSVT